MDIVEHDSENLERTMCLFADDILFELEPTGGVYRGKPAMQAFVDVAMSGRTHSGQYSIKITNWFTDGEQLCIEYTHGGILTGVFQPASRPNLSRAWQDTASRTIYVM